MTQDQIKAAIEKLAEMGAHVSKNITIKQLANIIEMATGNKRPYYIAVGDYVAAFAKPGKATPSSFNMMARKPFKWGHLRDAEIDRAQPPFASPGARAGNGAEPSLLWRR